MFVFIMDLWIPFKIAFALEFKIENHLIKLCCVSILAGGQQKDEAALTQTLLMHKSIGVIWIGSCKLNANCCCVMLS